MLVFLILLTNHELKILTSYSISAVLMTLKTPFLSRLFSSFHYESVNKGNIFSRVLILSCKKINISAGFCWNQASSHCVRSALRHGSFDLVYSSSIDSSSSVDLSGSSSDLDLGSRYSLTTIVLKSVEPLRSCILHVSFSRPSSLNRLVYLLL